MRIVRKDRGVAALSAVTAAGLAISVFGVTGASSAAAGLRAYPVCPSQDQRPLVSPTAGATDVLVPLGARQVLLCRYGGNVPSDQQRGVTSEQLTAQHLLRGKAATSDLAARFNALPMLTGSYNCPVDNGTAIIAFFRYASTAKADDPVTAGLTGCMAVTNGHVSRLAGPAASGPGLIHKLEFLTRRALYQVVPYRLLTHCGIQWARIRGTFWKAVHRLSDGHGHPPAGWDDPYQAGTLNFTSARKAVFVSPAGNVTFHRTERTRPPLICS